MRTRNIIWSSCGVYGCVCVVYIGMSVRGALQAGGSDWLGPFNTALIRDTHTHNRSNETLKAVGSRISILTSVSERCIYSFFKQ